MRRTWMGMAMLALCSVGRPVAARAQGGPEDAARAFLAALDARRWDDAAARVLPGAARLHQQSELSMMLAWAARRASGAAMTGSFAVSGADSVDPALLRRFGAEPAAGFGEARTLADVARMTPAVFMAGTLENAFTLPPNACCAAWGKTRYIGTVVENDSVAHALYRELPTGALPVRVTEQEAFRATVLELWRQGGRWYVIPDEMMLLRGMSIARMTMATRKGGANP
jgi:hypothetical protein